MLFSRGSLAFSSLNARAISRRVNGRTCLRPFAAWDTDILQITRSSRTTDASRLGSLCAGSVDQAAITTTAPPSSLASVIIFDADDIILAEIAACLNLD